MTMEKLRLHLPVMNNADSQMESKNNGSGEARRRGCWRASALALFLPGLVVAGGYAALWFYLHATGRGDGVLALSSCLCRAAAGDDPAHASRRASGSPSGFSGARSGDCRLSGSDRTGPATGIVGLDHWRRVAGDQAGE